MQEYLKHNTSAHFFILFCNIHLDIIWQILLPQHNITFGIFCHLGGVFGETPNRNTCTNAPAQFLSI